MQLAVAGLRDEDVRVVAQDYETVAQTIRAGHTYLSSLEKGQSDHP